jgi:hypothetical protein
LPVIIVGCSDMLGEVRMSLGPQKCVDWTESGETAVTLATYVRHSEREFGIKSSSKGL